MKNQITNTLNGIQKLLVVLLMVIISLPSIAQMPGGHPHGGHPHGGPGGNHPGGGHGGPHPALSCNAHFAHHRDSIVNGIRYNSIGGSGAATYAWDFGDGSTSTDADPSHTYAAAGTYYVCLTVTDTIGGGCTDTQCDSVHVFTPAPHCNAHFHVSPDSVANSANFHSGPGSSSATYAWDFGDGSTSTDQNPNHLYAAAGTYYVCLTVTNTNAGGTCSDTHCDSVNTNFPPCPGGGHGPHHPHRLSGDNTAGTASVAIYPNPMVDASTIYVENTAGSATIRIYSINGQIVYTQQLSNGDNKLSKENLTEGLYFYTVDEGNSNIAKGKLRVY